MDVLTLSYTRSSQITGRNGLAVCLPGENVSDMSEGVVLLIPAYRPAQALLDVVSGVLAEDATRVIESVVVVDDGSGPASAHLFAALASRPQVTVLRHAVNLGKGAALKTGFNHALLAWPDAAGIVTADADGQHAPPDIVNVARYLAAHPEEMVLGVRSFTGPVPLRSRLGNSLTRQVFRIFTGMWLSDTQTGLRGWPRRYCRENLPIAINGYDFELECLLKLHHSERRPAIKQLPIKTIYTDGNRGSHFNPIRDSMRIYFVFARYCGASMFAAVVDSLAFYLAYQAGASLALSQLTGRAVAVVLAFLIARNLVFRSDADLLRSLLKYLALVAAMGLVSYAMIDLLRERVAMPVVAAKMIAEGLLFVANFSIQRQLIFARSQSANGTH